MTSEQDKSHSLTSDAWRRLKKNKLALIGLGVIAVYFLVCLTAPVLPLYPYEEQVIEHANLPPSWGLKTAGELWLERETTLAKLRMERDSLPEISPKDQAKLAEISKRIQTEDRILGGKTQKIHQRNYFFGTDSLGRDLLSRTIFGGQISMAVGIVGALTSLLLGILIGALAGYLGGRLDYGIMRFIEVLYGLPYMLLVIIMMAIFGSNLLNLFIALSLVSWLTEAQVVRGQVISLKNSEFVEAARSIGASTPRIIFRHLLPNTLGIIIVFATLRVPTFIMSESFLSFLGLGVSAPAASWGSLIWDGVGGMSNYPWKLLVPGTAMTLFLFFMNFLGDGLRDAFDPQSKQR